jgi:hypothetical protein
LTIVYRLLLIFIVAMSGKRKTVVVSLETKFNAIKRLDSGESIKKMAADLGVGEVTVGNWRQKREEIKKYVNKSVSGGGVPSRKTLKKGNYEQTSEALFFVVFPASRDGQSCEWANATG